MMLERMNNLNQLRGGDCDANGYQGDCVRGIDLRNGVGVGVLESMNDEVLFGSSSDPNRHSSPYPLLNQ